ncbi:MAG TPA: hypothetical protein DDW50_11525 [Firmicutes bacterium]|jgi:hypothetical protein|nr:hypothetical protein [Bacillota bacterium]
MLPAVIEEIAVYVVPFATTGVTILLTMAGFYLHRNYQTSKFTQALIILDQIVIAVVQELNQTVVADLKAAKADGKLTKDEAEQIKHKAMELVIKKLGVDMLKTIQMYFGPITDILVTKIEAAVFDAKRTHVKNGLKLAKAH